MTFSINYKNEPVWTSSQPWQLDTCLSGKTRENCVDLSVLLFRLKFSVRSKMNSPTLRVRLSQTLLVLLAIVNAAIDIGNCGPKIKPLR